MKIFALLRRYLFSNENLFGTYLFIYDKMEISQTKKICFLLASKNL